MLHINSVIDIDLRNSDKFAIAAGVIIAGMEGLTGCVMTFFAVFALIAGNMVADKNPLARLVFFRI